MRERMNSFTIRLYLLITAFSIRACTTVGKRYNDVEDNFLSPPRESPRELQMSTALQCSDGQVGGYDCKNVNLQSRMTLSALGVFGQDEKFQASDIWGWTDPKTSREYAIIGLFQGTTFVDITTPHTPKVIAKLPATVEGSPVRDIKNYGKYAFIVSDTEGHGIQIFDMSVLSQITNPPVYVRPTAHYSFSGSFPNNRRTKVEKSLRGMDENEHEEEEKLGRKGSNDSANADDSGHPSWWVEGGDAHNIAINEQSGYAYLVGSDKCNGGLFILDIKNPLQPKFAGCFGETGYIHDVQCIIYDGPDSVYTGREICFASNGKNGLTIIDVTNKGGPLEIARLKKSYFEFIQQGWLTEQRNFFIMGDEGREGNTQTYVIDISNLDDPKVNGIHTSSITAQSHNMFVRGPYIYQANYRGGLRILNLLEIYGDNSEIGYFDVYKPNDDYGHQGAFGVYPFFESGNVVVSSVEDGLFVLQPSWMAPASTPVTDPSDGDDDEFQGFFNTFINNIIDNLGCDFISIILDQLFGSLIGGVIGNTIGSVCR